MANGVFVRGIFADTLPSSSSGNKKKTHINQFLANFFTQTMKKKGSKRALHLIELFANVDLAQADDDDSFETNDTLV